PTPNDGHQTTLDAAWFAVSFRSAAAMKEHLKVAIRRRHLFGLAIAGVTTTAASALVPEQTPAKSESPADKLKARYQPNSPEVRNFYRVNSYPRR
ncbi:MAG: hypothetical protein ABWY82_15700, partial [Tardiphaga sp.]